MSIVEQLEAAGETLSPAVRAALVALGTRVAELEAQVRELEARLAMNSTNSSKPPSSDPPGLPRRKNRLSGRKKGGQKGHPGSYRSLLPPERVDQVVEHRPESCRHCGHALDEAPVVGRPRLHQQIELPQVRAVVTEYRAPLLSCPRCGKHTRAALPAEVATSSFGPQLVAMGAMLISRFRLSRRDLKDFFTDLLDVPAPSLGSTQAFAREAAAAILPAYKEVRQAVRRSDRAGVDETGDVFISPQRRRGRRGGGCVGASSPRRDPPPRTLRHPENENHISTPVRSSSAAVFSGRILRNR